MSEIYTGPAPTVYDSGYAAGAAAERNKMQDMDLECEAENAQLLDQLASQRQAYQELVEAAGKISEALNSLGIDWPEVSGLDAALAKVKP